MASWQWQCSGKAPRLLQKVSDEGGLRHQTYMGREKASAATWVTGSVPGPAHIAQQS